MPVRRQVVAGEHGDRPAAGEAANPETGDQEADRGLRAARVGVVVGEPRVIGGELPRRRVMGVALLGHGEAHDLRARVRERAHDVVEVLAEKERAPDRADHGDPRPGGVALEQAVQPALRLQPVAYAGRLQRNADDAPVRILCEHRIGVHRLVCAMERAEAQMEDAGRNPGPVVARPGNVRGHPRQRVRSESLRRAAHCFFLAFARGCAASYTCARCWKSRWV